MSLRKNGRGLRFPCECVSVHRGYSDPWASITHNKLLNDGTKERILNSVAHRPKTIAGLAKELGLSQPAIHTHVSDLLSSELLRESPEWEKRHPAENYYEPNFPIVKARGRAAFDQICKSISREIADSFEKQMRELQRTLPEDAFASGGWAFSDVTHFCYATAQRGARRLLEQRGILPSAQKHQNGAEWVFWAEEPNLKAKR
jgi:DNA-binding transcriptional ArsR family regulator